VHSSSELVSADFSVVEGDEATSHADYFADVQITDRFGLVAPNGFEGAEAASLIMGLVTAFYDRYRERDEEYFAYPDFFSFQEREALFNYSMLDIWPAHKNVVVPAGGDPLLAAITDRGCTILILPDRISNAELAPVHVESLRRQLRKCYVYGEGIDASSADLTISCRFDPLRNYVMAMFDSQPDDKDAIAAKLFWEKANGEETLDQYFREITLVEAMSHL